MYSSDSSDDDSPELETLDLSNDKHYQVLPTTRAKNTIHEDFLQVPVYGSPTIKHSLSAYDLWIRHFPTHLSSDKFRNFHRPVLRHYRRGRQANIKKAFPIKSLSRQIYRAQKHLHNRIVRAINTGMSRDEIVSKFLFIRKAKDLTAKLGELILFEYCEEYPPVLSRIGMASNLKIYVYPYNGNSIHCGPKRPGILTKCDRDNMSSPQTTTANSQATINSSQNITHPKSEHTFGIREILSDQKLKTIYFSPLKPGTETMFIENNLYRAPVYPHEMNDCDFVVIRTRNNIYVRSCQKIFTVGQTVTLDIVPPPTDKTISKFRADLSNLHIHKLFKESDTNSRSPAIIELEQLQKAFPDYHVSHFKRRLACRGAKHISNGLYHRDKSSFGLGSLKEDRSILKPEQYCLYMSMLANRQRLRELNYLESMILPTDNVELETEVLAAPWNTSKAIHDANLGRCFLDFKKHLIDPTGPKHEGFSCVSWVKSPTEEVQRSQQKDTTRGPGKPPAEFLTNPMTIKIRREKLERMTVYQNEAQLISNVQTDVLSSHEVLSSDEDSDAGADEDEEDKMNSSFDQQLKDLGRLVVDGRTNDELNFEREEEERLDLMSTYVNDPSGTATIKIPNQTGSQDTASRYKNKVLKITRRYTNEDGEIEIRTEVVREPQTIARYVQLKSEAEPSPQGSVEIFGSNMPTPETTASPQSNRDILIQPSRRSSLGASELSRIDGNKLIISKLVLKKNRRPGRSSNRTSSNSSFWL